MLFTGQPPPAGRGGPSGPRLPDVGGSEKPRDPWEARYPYPDGDDLFEKKKKTQAPSRRISAPFKSTALDSGTDGENGAGRGERVFTAKGFSATSPLLSSKKSFSTA